MVAEAGRLTAGKATQLLYVILTASLGQIVKQDEAFNERVCDLRTGDLKELCCCDERTIQRELTDLARRKVILWEQTKKGVNSITPLFRHWEGLPDYKPAPVLEPEAESGDEPVAEDPAQNAKETTHITREPVYVRAGKQSKRFPIACGVAAFQMEVKGRIDAECSAVVKDGVLRVVLEGKWDGKTLGGSTLQEKGLGEKPRQGCRISPNATESKQTKSERRNLGEQLAKFAKLHPRAEEISALFDPPLLNSCRKSLSADLSCLRQACELLTDVPATYISECLAERAGREFKLSHVRAFCQEVSHNYKKVKDLPESKKLPTREQIDEMIRQERAARKARRSA